MPQLDWDELIFLEFLGVEPMVDDYSTSHTYEVEHNELRLLLTLWQYESVIHLSLFRKATTVPLFSFASFVRGGIRLVNDKRGKYLELMDCIVGPTRFWYIQAGDLFDREKYAHGITVQVEIRPEIRIALEPA